MHSYEFKTIVEDNIIHLPEEMRGKISHAVKVTLSIEDEYSPSIVQGVNSKAGGLSIDDFQPFINTKGWKFDREEANERR
jgi:C4-type Zn-finger protein